MWIDQFGHFGGAQLCALDAMPALLRRGDDLHAMLPAGPMHGRLNELGIKTTTIPCGPYRSASKSIADAWRFVSDTREQIRMFTRVVQSHRPDLIYVNGPRVLTAVARVAGSTIPVLFHSHHHITQRTAQWMAARVLRQCRVTTIACSTSVAQQWLDRGVLVQVVPNGVPGLPYRERVIDSRGTWSVGMVGALSEEKGQHLLLDALGALEQRPRVTLFGPASTPTYVERLKALAHGHSVSLVPWREEAAEIYGGLDVLVVASAREGMPRVILEAFSAGVLVMACPAPGVSELIVDGETGLLATERSSKALALALGRIAALNSASIASITRQARQAWQSRHTLEHYQQQILQVTLDAAARQ